MGRNRWPGRLGWNVSIKMRSRNAIIRDTKVPRRNAGIRIVNLMISGNAIEPPETFVAFIVRRIVSVPRNGFLRWFLIRAVLRRMRASWTGDVSSRWLRVNRVMAARTADSEAIHAALSHKDTVGSKKDSEAGYTPTIEGNCGSAHGSQVKVSNMRSAVLPRSCRNTAKAFRSKGGSGRLAQWHLQSCRR